MKKYKCHKIVEAGQITDIERTPPNKGDPLGLTVFTVTTGEKIPMTDHRYLANASAGQYLVRYEDGYTSISPAKAFEEGYTEIGEAPVADDQRSICDSGLHGTFGFALAMLKNGNAIARAGWNGKRMFVYMVPANAYPAQTDIAKARFGGQLVPYNAYMALVGVDDRVSTWVPSSTDVLAEDWTVYSVDSIAHDWAQTADLEPITADKFMGNMQNLGKLKESFRGSGVQVDKIIADMNKCDDDIVKARLQTLGKDAPRVRPEDLTANIVSAEYVKHVTGSGQILRWAILTTQSGFAVTGKPSAAVCAGNDDEKTGLQVAYDNARSELWTLMGYALKEELHRRAQFDAEPKTGGAASTMPPHQQRVITEKAELDSKIAALTSFIGNPGMFGQVPEAERDRLHHQLGAMADYSNILASRIATF